MRSILSPETTTTVSRSVPPLPSSRVATLRAIGRLGCGSSQVSGGLFATPIRAGDGWDCTDFMRLVAALVVAKDTSRNRNRSWAGKKKGARRWTRPCQAPAYPCQDNGEVLADPHLKAHDMIVDLDCPTRG